LGVNIITYNSCALSKELATRLSACQEVAKLLVEEQRSCHRELINACPPDPHVYSVGNIVFAQRAVRSDSKRGIVDILQYAFTGPWRVTAVLTGASYELEHCDSKRKYKKHASNLSPYPVELILFQPVDGADTRYGQLFKPISAHPFKEAGIKGFTPTQPYKVTSHLAITTRCTAFHWPSLSELNDEFAPFPWANDDKFQRYIHGDSITKLPVLATGPPPAGSTHFIPKTPATPTYSPPSLTVWTDCSLSPTVLGLIHLVNGDM
jgi:hypothetical protein